MKLVLSKPTIVAFEGDLRDSISALNFVKSQLGIEFGKYKINPNLEIEFGLQLIVRLKDLSSLEKLEKNIAQTGADNFCLAVHAPYNYEDPETWQRVDLSRGKEGLTNLLKVVEFSDRINALSTSVHPNAIRKKEEILFKKSRKKRLGLLDNVISNILEAQDYALFTSIDLENKPLPATTPDNERMIYTVTCSPLGDLKKYVDAGGRLTFDTCHYAITQATFNHLISSPKASKAMSDLGYFIEDINLTPTGEAMLNLGESINHIHLNDGSIYKPFPETGRPNINARLPSIGGIQLYWEAYVPGYGELSKNEDVFPWIKKYQTSKRTIPLTIEVTEFDNNYSSSPRFKEGAISFVKNLEASFNKS